MWTTFDVRARSSAERGVWSFDGAAAGSASHRAGVRVDHERPDRAFAFWVPEQAFLLRDRRKGVFAFSEFFRKRTRRPLPRWPWCSRSPTFLVPSNTVTVTLEFSLAVPLNEGVRFFDGGRLVQRHNCRVFVSTTNVLTLLSPSGFPSRLSSFATAVNVCSPALDSGDTRPTADARRGARAPRFVPSNTVTVTFEISLAVPLNEGLRFFDGERLAQRHLRRLRVDHERSDGAFAFGVAEQAFLLRDRRKGVFSGRERARRT